MPGYEFEFSVPTPLAFGGVGKKKIIDETLHYTILEKTSNEAFQALWIELRFAFIRNIICGIIYCQDNSSERFLAYFEQTLEKFISPKKNVCVMGDFNLCLLKVRYRNLVITFYYRKIPKISPGAYIFQRPFLKGLSKEGNCVSKSIGLAL